MNNYFCLHACCLVVKGYAQSIICDLQRDAYIPIPNELYEILVKDISEKSIKEIVSELESDAIIEWLNLLAEKEYGFYVDTKYELAKFPSIKWEFFEAKPITNAIIDIDQNSCHDIENIFTQLSELLCEVVELRFFYSEQINKISSLLSMADDSSFRSIEILVQFSLRFTEDEINGLFNNCDRLHKLTLHGANKNMIKEIVPGKKIIVFTDQLIDSEKHCGIVSKSMFVSNAFMFAEAKYYNSCLNKKISVDRQGFIKNCPSYEKSYGHISHILLKDVLKNEKFRLPWQINKDKIEDCKICEFRYICQDCRAYVKNKDNQYSKPLKCRYNPYEAIWE